MEKDEQTELKLGKPLPNDFNEYLPWACKQMQVEVTLVINKVYQNEYVSIGQTDRSKGKPKSKTKNETSRPDIGSTEKESGVINKSSDLFNNIIKIDTVFDSNDNLIELKFDKTNTSIPRMVLKVIGLIINFQNNLTRLTINRGLNKIGVYEISKIIPISNITDVCLDNNVMSGANYDSLLEHNNFIRYLSLARCRIDDDIIKNIASKLEFPLPSSKTLIILNLATNRITDEGAKYLAKVLRSNRQLAYLNLSDNMITDNGAIPILETLIDFPLTSEELLLSRIRKMEYLKEKNSLIAKLLIELRFADVDKKLSKKKISKPATARKNKMEKEGSIKTLSDFTSKTSNSDYDKAVYMAENLLGEFKDPYSPTNIYRKDNVIYCKGNNSLSYINFSYNNLSFLTVKKLNDVLKIQSGRNPKGLVNVLVEGNHLPIYCQELSLVDSHLQVGLEVVLREQFAKKRPASNKK